MMPPMESSLSMIALFVLFMSVAFFVGAFLMKVAARGLDSTDYLVLFLVMMVLVLVVAVQQSPFPGHPDLTPPKTHSPGPGRNE